MDKKTLIGFAIIGVLLITMFTINSRNRLALEAEQLKKADSIALVNKKADSIALVNKKNTVAGVINSIDSVKPNATTQSSSFLQNSAESNTIVENEVLKITFTNKGAQPKIVELRKFKKHDGKPVLVQQGDFNQLNYRVNADNNRTVAATDLLFNAEPEVINADKSKTLRFSVADSTGKKIVHAYTLYPNKYLVDLNISFEGSDRLFSQQSISFNWQTEAPQVEKDHAYELTQSHVCYVENGDFDFEYMGSGDELTFSKPVSWISFKQQFFATAVIAKNKFSAARSVWTIPPDSNKNYLARMTTDAQHSIGNGNVTQVPLQLFYGPSDYNILKQYGNQMENIVPYGTGVFAFVKYINRHFLLPVFDFLQKNIASMGIVILLLTLLIRLITSPILYKSYLSGAKMKMLKPEVDALKAKFTDPKTQQLDQQAFGMEQMKLWKQAGVNPLGGCLPALLQIPIFMSLYYFFQSNVDLRGKSFLWADDLAQYDSIASLPFSIPFYGDHVSLFTLTAVITSLLISLYSMANMQDNNNPVMKYMPYIFPVLLLGIFNNLPAALTWYYTVSNAITLILQFVIQKYIIDHDKIMAQIAENRKRPVKKSKMQERIEAMQESQRKMQELKNKGKNK